MQTKQYSIEVGGKQMLATFSDLAEKANGSVMLQYGDTIVHATAVMSDEEKDSNFFPLTVDYEERFYATGQILGSRFMRREGRPSDEAILSGRVVDRTIRPLFDHRMRNEVQVVIMILSLGEYDPDILALNAASLALATSDIPWCGPVAAVRIIRNKDGDAYINPTFLKRGIKNHNEKEKKGSFLNKPLLDLVACGRDKTINMVEAEADGAKENLIIETLEKASEELYKLQAWQEGIAQEIGKEKRKLNKPEISQELEGLFEEEISPKLDEAVFSGSGKVKISSLEKKWCELARDRLEGVPQSLISYYYEEKVNNILHKEAIENGRRADGRGLDEVRPLFAKAGGLSPLLHGSGIFYRGGTHVLSALTLGGPGDSLIIEGMEVQTKKRFVHHYNFPPFAPGETGRIGGFNRRMIGHGALAEKALRSVIPPQENFPYTIRVVSEVMSSNGSTSMASVCASTLALMDGGVPIKAPVAGIASGIMYESPKRYALLTDIQGPEDEHGDMDFKVAGTREGITAVQMDVKVSGIPVNILEEALYKAREARHKILDVIEKEIQTPREKLSPSAPIIKVIKIKTDQIGMVIGPGGKMVNEIRELTDTNIDIEEDGTVYITGKENGAAKAKGIIESMTREYTPGDRIEGTVTRVADFGAFVKVDERSEGLVHVSELAPFRVEKVSDFLKEGDRVPVVVKAPNESGKLSLSIKDANPSFFQKPIIKNGAHSIRGTHTQNHHNFRRPHH